MHELGEGLIFQGDDCVCLHFKCCCLYTNVGWMLSLAHGNWRAQSPCKGAKDGV